MEATISQTPAFVIDYSATMTGSWVKVLSQVSGRTALSLMNVGTHNIGIYFAPPGNNGATPTPVGIGSKGVFTLGPAAAANGQGGTYEPDGPFIEVNELWAIGTASDILICAASPG